jgi:hypothetical protein
MSRKRYPYLAWNPETHGVYPTSKKPKAAPAPRAVRIAPWGVLYVQTPDGTILIEPAWDEHADEVERPLLDLDRDTFQEVCDLQARLDARKPKPRTPERDHHFRVLHDKCGWSYEKIAKRDSQARAAELTRDAVIAAVRRDRQREKKSQNCYGR